MNKPIKLRHFKHLCMTIGNLPSSYIDSMSYYETLLWLIKFLKDEVVPTVNNNSQVVEELQEFVDHYFDNLDVQDEINNKLDDMAEKGILQEIISEYLNSKAIFGYDTVADMKQATNLINGSYARTLGYYTKNDNGGALYKIRTITSEDIDNVLLIPINEELVAELIVNNETINAKQIGCKTDGTDNSVILNNYFEKNLNYKLYFPSGEYAISNEIDTTGSIIMNEKAWLKAISSMECCIHINKNLVVSGSFSDDYPKNLEFKLNINCNKLARTGIRTDKLHWAKATLTVKDPILYGVHTRYDLSKGHAENTFDIQVSYDYLDGSNTATGLYIGGSDDIYNNIVSINTKYGVELRGGDNSINTIHCWLINKDLWNGSVMLKTSANKNHISNLIVDTYETGIELVSNYPSNGTFDLIIDYMFGAINTTFIPEELRTSYKLWNLVNMNETSKRNSKLIINEYLGNDTNTAKISLGNNGECPYNTKLGYSNDYISPTWSYSLDLCPEGQFHFLGNTNVKGKPSSVTGGTYNLVSKNTPYGKIQELIPEQVTTTTGSTTYSGNTPTGNFNYYWKRVFNKYGNGTNSWGDYGSFYISEPTS